MPKDSDRFEKDEQLLKPLGFLLLRGITQEEWDKAVAAREKQSENKFSYRGLIAVGSKAKDMDFQIIPRVVDGFVQNFVGVYYRTILAFKSPWKFQLTLGVVLVMLLLLITLMSG